MAFGLIFPKIGSLTCKRKTFLRLFLKVQLREIGTITAFPSLKIRGLNSSEGEKKRSAMGEVILSVARDKADKASNKN